MVDGIEMQTSLMTKAFALDIVTCVSILPWIVLTLTTFRLYCEESRTWILVLVNLTALLISCGVLT